MLLLSVNWVFLTETLQHNGLGQRMMHWIHGIYSRPFAQVKVNGLLSPSFGITNGTR